MEREDTEAFGEKGSWPSTEVRAREDQRRCSTWQGAWNWGSGGEKWGRGMRVFAVETAHRLAREVKGVAVGSVVQGHSPVLAALLSLALP